MRGALALPIAVNGRTIELPLVAERVVQALAANPHRIDEQLRRRSIIAMFAEHTDRLIQRYIRIEFPRLCHDGRPTCCGTIIQ
jgi:hypothetical protein